MVKKGCLSLHYGCKVNQYETNGMIEQFLKNGYELVEWKDKADIYVVNTCTVTNMSERKSRQALRHAKQINPKSLVVAVGCYVQVAKEQLERIPEIDIVLGTNEKNQIVEVIEGYKKEKEEVLSDVMNQKEFQDFGVVTYTEKTRAVIKIQDGCDRFCSYCIIPYARGRVRSRRRENVIQEVEKMVQKGIQEIVLTGIHLASYGKDFKQKYALIDLVEELNYIEGIKRIRLGSLEPTLMTEEFVARLSKLQHICDHFHLSLQSGCNETLKRMNRHYTVEEFEEIVIRLRKVYPHCALTTDIIVGFPQETQEEFQKTYEFIKRIAFYKMHVFAYSPRKGTKAAMMPNQVESFIKQQRSNRLLDLSNQNQAEQNERIIGQQVQVLFEEKKENTYQGHTTNYMEVKVPSEVSLENQIKQVQIIGKEGLVLIGKCI